MLLKKLLLLFSSNIFTSLLGFINILLISKFLGAESIGVYGSGIAFIGIFSFLLEGGFNITHLKFIAEGNNELEKIAAFTTIKVILTLVFLLIIIFSIYVFDFLDLAIKSNSTKIKFFVLLIGLATAIRGLYNIPLQTLAAKRYTKKQIIPIIIGSVLRTILIIIVVFKIQDVFFIGYCLLISEMATLFLFYYKNKEFVIFRITKKKYYVDYIFFTIPFLLISITSSLEKNLDKLVLGMYTNVFFVGIFFTIQKFTIFFPQLAKAITTIFLPTYSENYAKDNSRYIGRKAVQYEHFLILISLPLILNVLFFGNSYLSLIGNKYTPYGNILSIILIANVILISTIPISEIITAIGKPKIKAYISIFYRSIQAILFFVLIPKSFLGITMLNLGITGVAYSILVGYILFGFLVRFYIQTKKDIGYKFTFFAPLIAGIILLAIYGIFNNFIVREDNLIYSFNLLIFSYPLVYFILAKLRYFQVKNIKATIFNKVN